MLYGKKIIGYCTSRVNSIADNALITGLNDKLRDDGYIVFVYATCSDLFWKTPIEDGEKTVFELLDMDVLDALVITYEKIKDKALAEDIIRRGVDKGLPVFVIDGYVEGCINLNFDYRRGFDKIVRHVVEEHGIRRLHMMAGIKDNPYSDERIGVFRDVLAEHGIPFDDSMVSYGDFWSGPTIKATERLIASGSLPEAIICANDTMAVTVCAVMKQHGISVPENIVVTGFDGIDDVQVASPAISTCLCRNSLIVSTIADILTGRRKPAQGGEAVMITPQLTPAESCGCTRENNINVSEVLTKSNDRFHRYQSDEHTLFQLSANISTCSSSDEIAEYMGNEDTIYNMTCVVRKECIDETVDPLTIPENSDDDRLYLLFDADSPKPFVPYEFDRNEIFPDIKKQIDSGYPLIFVALNFLHIPLGYLCFHFQVNDVENYYKIPQMVNIFNNALGGFRNIRYQQYLNARMEEIYKLDRLTGLYNRNALVNTFEEREESMRRGKERITFILADLDRLKYINDTFGHMEGDFAIHSVAEALRLAAPVGAVLARWGGDELVALFTGECDAQAVKRSMQEYLESRVREHSKPYEITASVGVVSVEPSELTTLEEITKASDRLMYEEKLARRRARGQ